MERELKKEISDALKEGRKLQLQGKEALRDEERSLKLMEAGLETRPLDRDFYEKMKMKHEMHKNEYQLMTTLLDKLEDKE